MMKFSLSLYSLILVLGMASGQSLGGQEATPSPSGDLLKQFLPHIQQNAQASNLDSRCIIKAWSESCPKQPRPFIIFMSSALITYIINLHNYLRESTGAMQPMKPIRWSWELAELAEVNVMQCRISHDDCAAQAFKSSGQNLAINSYSGRLSSRSNDELVKASIQSWWAEYKASQKENLGWGLTVGVGCAASRFFEDDTHKFLMACNYATIDPFGRLERA